jgi:hypothetical protein
MMIIIIIYHNIFKFLSYCEAILHSPVCVNSLPLYSLPVSPATCLRRSRRHFLQQNDPFSQCATQFLVCGTTDGRRFTRRCVTIVAWRRYVTVISSWVRGYQQILCDLTVVNNNINCSKTKHDENKRKPTCDDKQHIKTERKELDASTAWRIIVLQKYHLTVNAEPSAVVLGCEISLFAHTK